MSSIQGLPPCTDPALWPTLASDLPQALPAQRLERNIGVAASLMAHKPFNFGKPNFPANLWEGGWQFHANPEVGTKSFPICGKITREKEVDYPNLRMRNGERDYSNRYAEVFHTKIIRRGVAASQAIQDIFLRPQQYRFDCGSAVAVLQYKGILDTVGPQCFDALFPDLKISMGSAYTDLDQYNETVHVDGEEDLKPGDHVVFRNPDVAKEHDEAWEAENAVYLGAGAYYAFPFGVRTSDQILAALNAKRKPGATESAYLMPQVERLRSDLLFGN